MKLIPLTRGKFAIVDDAYFEIVNAYKWHAIKARRTFYAVTCLPRIYQDGKVKRPRLYMHRLILGTPKGMDPDHIDGNGLDNQMANLRTVTHRQNLQNITSKKKTSKYPGVSWDKTNRRWRSHIRVNGPQETLGSYRTEAAAFEAYRRAVAAIGQEVLA